MTSFAGSMDDGHHSAHGHHHGPPRLPPSSLPSLLPSLLPPSLPSLPPPLPPSSQPSPPSPLPHSPPPTQSGEDSDDDGGIPAPREPPHRSGLQPRKGCFKPPGQLPRRVTRSRSGRGVTFSADDRCLVTGGPFTPNPRDRVEWQLARTAGESPEKREKRRLKAEKRAQRRRRNNFILAGRAAAAAAAAAATAAAAQGGPSCEGEGATLEDEEKEEDGEDGSGPAAEEEESEPSPVTEEEKALCPAEERALADEARRKEHSRRIRSRLREARAKWGYVPRNKVPWYER